MAVAEALGVVAPNTGSSFEEDFDDIPFDEEEPSRQYGHSVANMASESPYMATTERN
jgi:hypothetical protein